MVNIVVNVKQIIHNDEQSNKCICQGEGLVEVDDTQNGGKKCSVKCGDLTQEKGQTVDSQCTCVKGAQQKDKRTCECKQTYKTINKN